VTTPGASAAAARQKTELRHVVGVTQPTNQVRSAQTRLLPILAAAAAVGPFMMALRGSHTSMMALRVS
jgi:hypothetical protein